MFDNLFQCFVITALLFAVAVVMLSIAKSAVIIKEGNAAVIERQGRFRKVLGPGYHVIMPFMDEKRAEVTLSEQHFDTGQLSLSTSNLAPISFNMSVHYEIMRDPTSPYLTPIAESVYRAVYTVHDWQEITKEEALAVVTQVVGSLDFKSDILDVRGWGLVVGNKVKDDMNKRANRWGVHIADINITNIQYADATREIASFEGRAKREARKRVIEAEGVREIAQTLGMTNDEMLRWRYIETLREAMNKPDARIMITPEQNMGGMNPAMLASQYARLSAPNTNGGSEPPPPDIRVVEPAATTPAEQQTLAQGGQTVAMPMQDQQGLTPGARNRPPMREVRTRDEELGR
jgi:regulator of protease activity HflC (stomatin/prohibitin superfamily)